MKVLSLFSGVGGFDLGLENAGMETVFQCEWDKHATKILERHWPDVPRWGDVSTLTGAHVLQHAPIVDVVAWGSPCQDLSVAGKRAGLEGGRSGLFYEGMRIISELRKETNGKYPRISVWENVYGALNSNKGDDFETILKEMVEAGALLCEWRVLDAQYFGIPQRRRRVFVVAVFDSATAARCPDPLLPVSEGLRWHPKTGAATRQEPSGTATGSIGNGCAIANSITAELYHHGSVVNQDANNGHVIVESFTGTSHAQYGEGVGTLRANGGDLGGGSETLLLDGTRVDDVRVYESPVQTLKERMGTGGNNVPMLMFDTQFGSNANVFENQLPTLKASQAAPSVAYNGEPVMLNMQGSKGNSVTTEDGISYSLNAMHGHDVHAVAYDEYNDALGGDVHHALRAGTKQSTGVMESTMAVRRLTPLECERLMGWPDNWTSGQSDTHRYKQCGNGVASPVAQWIGEQLNNL